MNEEDDNAEEDEEESAADSGEEDNEVEGRAEAEEETSEPEGIEEESIRGMSSSAAPIFILMCIWFVFICFGILRSSVEELLCYILLVISC